MTAIVQSLRTESHALASGALATGARALAGFGIGALIGVVVSLALAASATFAAVVAPYVLAAKSVPVLSLIPLFILWFGLTEQARIGFIATACFFWVVVAATEAIRNVPVIYGYAARSLGASRFEEYREVVLPAILPGLFGGIRNSATVSFALAVASEFLGAEQGIGFYLIHESTYFQLSNMIAAVVVVTLMAIVTDQVLLQVGRRFLSWSGRA
jgi:ABC-type nitrate/sulfonate/bicarbonate transport system permease component